MTTPADIIAAARTRWPQWGPWKITVTYYQNGKVEWALFGKSSSPAKIENRYRIGRDLEELVRRVLEPDAVCDLALDPPGGHGGA